MAKTGRPSGPAPCGVNIPEGEYDLLCCMYGAVGEASTRRGESTAPSRRYAGAEAGL